LLRSFTRTALPAWHRLRRFHPDRILRVELQRLSALRLVMHRNLRVDIIDARHRIEQVIMCGKRVPDQLVDQNLGRVVDITVFIAPAFIPTVSIRLRLVLVEMDCGRIGGAEPLRNIDGVKAFMVSPDNIPLENQNRLLIQ
jgi:hypothetical protein